MLVRALELSGYTLNPFSISTLMAAFMILVFGAAILARDGFSRASLTFLVITSTIAGWLSAYSAMYAADDPGVAKWWAEIGLFFVALLPAAAYHFTAVALQRVHIVRRYVVAGWIASIALSIFVQIAPVVTKMVRVPWGWNPRLGPVGSPLFIALGIALAACARQYMVVLRATQDETQRIRVHGLVLAFLFGAASTIDFLPAYGVVIYPLGYLAAFSFTVIAAWTIWERRMVGITPEFAAGQILETMQGAVLVTDVDGVVRLVNRAFCRLLGYGESDLIGRVMRDIVASPFGPDERVNLQRSSWGIRDREIVWRTKDGREVAVSVSASIAKNQRGMPAGVIYVAADVTERRNAVAALRKSEERYRLLFERNLAGVYRNTLSGRILDCNDACARIFGYKSRAELLEKGALEVYFDPAERQRVIGLILEQGSITNFEECFRRKDGTPVWIIENVSVTEDENGEKILEGTVVDITDRKIAEQRIVHQAFHDSVTGLPNRLLFKDRLGVAIGHAHRSGRAIAVMFLDLDHFKRVNDTLGHTAGDELLNAVGARLRQSVREEDTVARLGGDEFTLLVADLAGAHDAMAVAQKVLHSVSEPVVIEGTELRVTTSIGISMYPADGADADTLLKNADAAMYRAKDKGRNNYQLCSPPISDRSAGPASGRRASAT